MSAIHWASRNGHDEVVRVLSHAGADINTQYKVIHTFENVNDNFCCIHGYKIIGKDSSLVSQFQWSPEMRGALN